MTRSHLALLLSAFSGAMLSDALICHSACAGSPPPATEECSLNDADRHEDTLIAWIDYDGAAVNTHTLGMVDIEPYRSA